MRRRLGAVVALLAVALIALAPAAVAQPAQPTPPVPSGAGEDAAVQNYGGCLRGQKAGSLLVLIDESTSLQTSDAEGARIVAARYLSSQLAALAQRNRIRLDVAVAGFAADFRLDSDWVALDPGSDADVAAAVDGFRARNTGFETDYVTALEGARQALADHARDEPDAGRCRAIAWFTDGKLDITPRISPADRAANDRPKSYAEGVDLTTEQGAAQAEERARTSLCRDGGTADQLRSGGITTFAVGLAPSGTPPAEFDLLRNVATGSGSCGGVTSPVPGNFQLASNIDDLLFAFDRILGPGLDTDTGVCRSVTDTCTDRHRFVLDDSVDGVHILGTSDRPAATVALRGPDGRVYPLERGDVLATREIAGAGVRLTYSWQSPRTVVVDLARTDAAPAGWVGVWDLVFVDPSATPAARSRSTIHIWGNLLPVWANPSAPGPVSGTVVPDVRLGLTKIDGTPVDPATLPGELALSAVLVGRDGRERPVADRLSRAALASPVRLDLTGVPPGPAVLRLTLDVTTAPAVPPGGGAPVPGTALAPQQVDVPVPVQTPAEFPGVAGPVDFGTADGTAALTGTLPVTGPGCVWIAPEPRASVVAAPDGVAGVTVAADQATSAATCLRVEPGEQAELPLRFSADRPGNGAVNGSVRVSAAPLDQPQRAIPVEVGFTVDMRKPLDTGNFLLTLLAALLLGPGIPLGLLYLVNLVAARIPAGQGLYARVIPVTIDGDRVLRDGVPFTFDARDLKTLVNIPPRGIREFVAGPVLLRARIARSPFKPGYVSATAENRAAASSTDAFSYGRERAARLPLAVQDTWVVLHNPDGPADRAEVLVLAAVSPSGRGELIRTVNGDVPGIVARMRSAFGSAGSTGSGRPSGRPSDGPSGPPPVPAGSGGTGTPGPVPDVPGGPPPGPDYGGGPDHGTGSRPG